MYNNTKICSKCKSEKSLNEFQRKKKSKDGYQNYCKICKKFYRKEYYEKNRKKEIYNNRLYKKKNKEKLKEYNKYYYQENKNERNKYTKKWRSENKEFVNKSRRIYKKCRYDDDIMYRISENVRSMITKSLKRNNYSKESKTFDILGCSYEDLLMYLNDNPYNFKYGEVGLDIDHIVPLSSAYSEEDILRLNHYSNLQLLPSYYNRYVKKGGEFDILHFENWLKENYE